MSKSRKKVVKDRFEKKKMIAFKNKNKKFIEEVYDEDTEAEEILLQTVRQENCADKIL
jgi:fructose-1,6-bisphosphatase/inositol monophosphatase family enzyme